MVNEVKVLSGLVFCCRLSLTASHLRSVRTELQQKQQEVLLEPGVFSSTPAGVYGLCDNEPSDMFADFELGL